MKPASLILASLVCTLYAVTSCSEPDECTGPVTCYDYVGGSIPLHPNSLEWLPKGDDITVFINSGGVTMNLNFLRSEADKDRVFIVDKATERCCDELNVTFSGEAYLKEYAFDVLPLNILYKLQKNHDGGDIRGHDYDTIPDLLTITVNARTFFLPLEKNKVQVERIESNFLEKRDTLTLNNTLYHNVYHLYYTDASPNKVMPDEVFYTKEEGVVGIGLNNDERWYKE